MFLVTLLRALKNDLCSPSARFTYLNFILKDLPGEMGVKLRTRVVASYFQSAGKGVRVLQGARFIQPGKLAVGDGVWIGVDNILQAAAGITIGDHTVLAPGVKIWSINHRFEALDQPIVSQGWDYKPVRIGAHVWIASNVFVMPGVEIPDGCIISAGSVVGVKKYPPYSIIAGNPARVIGTRRPGTDPGAAATTAGVASPS